MKLFDLIFIRMHVAVPTDMLLNTCTDSLTHTHFIVFHAATFQDDSTQHLSISCYLAINFAHSNLFNTFHIF
jgi:hypothetical protein